MAHLKGVRVSAASVRRRTEWAAAQRRELRDGAPETVLANVRALPTGDAPASAAAAQMRAEVLGYLEPRLAQMQYAAFRAQGLPIGSGIVASANKVVVEARLKGAGRRWTEQNVTALLAVRGAWTPPRDRGLGRGRRPAATPAAAVPAPRDPRSGPNFGGASRRGPSLTERPITLTMPHQQADDIASDDEEERYGGSGRE